ncbi:WAP four-disulfide core domain protein 18-like [Ornithorhynchus anatinus]|nr:WAP four-disulfide core domain protein 18-like [Ornithorhynchus anatinus]
MKSGSLFVLVALLVLESQLTGALSPVKGGSVRPGTCPMPKKGNAGICTEACKGDDSCPRGQKCCSNGCGHVCMTPETGSSGNICEKPMDKGLCMAYMPKFYYNSKTKKCESFIYGGCQGNENRFDTVEECMARCGGKQKV